MDKVWVITIEWAANGGTETDLSVYLFHNESNARAEMEKCIKEEKENDHIFDSDYVEEESENTYVVYEDGSYCEDHWSITIEEKVIH